VKSLWSSSFKIQLLSTVNVKSVDEIMQSAY